MNFRNQKQKEDTRELCQYGSSCYRKNEDHLKKFKHPVKAKHEPKKAANGGILKQQKLNIFFTKNNCKSSEEAKRKRRSSDEHNETDRPSCSSEFLLSTTSPVKESERKKVSEIDHNEDKNEDVPFHNISEEQGSEIIKKLFLVNMPKDFYHFWLFCKSLSPENPLDALETVNLHLVGAYDVMAGLIDDTFDSSAALRHWRYYYDPPEFQTVLRSTKSDGFHLGYFRDEPECLPVFVSSNNATKNGTIVPVAENLFAAVDWHVKEFDKTATPFSRSKTSKLKTELLAWAEKYGYTMEKNTKKMRARDRNVVARTFHHVGIVVPYDKKTELGYRPLAETSSNLTKILKQIDDSKNDDERKIYFSKLHEIVTWANIAMDEGDYGTCLELGLDLFCYGSTHLHKVILQVLLPAYNLLNRSAFGTILKAHLECRRKGSALSALTQQSIVEK